MKTAILSIILSFCCMFIHAQQRLIKVTLDNIPPYDVLKCRTTSNLTGNTEYLGDYQANTNSWLYQIPDSILDQAQYFQFFGKRNDSPEIKFMHPASELLQIKTQHSFSQHFLIWKMLILYSYMLSLCIKTQSETVLFMV